MTDIVRTTGRPMTGALQSAIDNCEDRGTLAAALLKLAMETTSRMAPLYSALALELNLAEVRATDERLGLERGWQADLEDTGPAWPKVEGNPAWFDPDTGGWTS